MDGFIYVIVVCDENGDDDDEEEEEEEECEITWDNSSSTNISDGWILDISEFNWTREEQEVTYIWPVEISIHESP